MEQVNQSWQEARHLIREYGVTYNVYGDPHGTERPWELGCEFHWVGWDSNVAQARIADYIRKKLG